MIGSFARMLVVWLAMATFALIGIGAGTATAAPRTAVPGTATVTGTLADGTGAVQGVFNVLSFTAQDGTVQAIGTFSGTITDAAGTVTSGSQQVALPMDLTQSHGDCQILDLVLGPLDLDLLGLQVHLDQVHLNITAVPGPGNLLGNLLCAIAHLLDGPTGVNAILERIADLLNRALGVQR